MTPSQAVWLSVLPCLPSVLRSFNTNRLVELVKSGVHLAICAAEPKSVQRLRCVVLAFVSTHDREAGIELYAVPGIMKAEGCYHVALGLGLCLGQLEDASKNGVFGVLARLPGRPNGSEYIGRNLN